MPAFFLFISLFKGNRKGRNIFVLVGGLTTRDAGGWWLVVGGEVVMCGKVRNIKAMNQS